MPENRPGGAPAAAPRLLDRLRNAIYARHYSPRTAEAYVFWARRFILFHGKRHPDAMGAAEVKSFLTDLALSHKVAASTQNQALSALLFLYRQVLGRELNGLAGLIRAKRPKRAPVVLSPEEITRILQYLHGLPYLAVVLMYGSGLRLMECLELRIQDIDFDRGEVRVREGKGQKDRRTPLSPQAADLFRPHIEALRRQHAHELKTGVGGAFVPEAIRRTVPDAAMDWGWQWVFPSTIFTNRPTDPGGGITSTKPRFKEPSRRRSSAPASSDAPPATPCATPSRRICSKQSTISGRSRSLWGTRTCRPRWSTLTS